MSGSQILIVFASRIAISRGGRSGLGCVCGTVIWRLSCNGPGEVARGSETVFWHLSVQIDFLTCVVLPNDSLSVEWCALYYGWSVYLW